MCSAERRTINELLARYDLEPELQDVIVEGEYDCDLLRSSIASSSTNVLFYSIDTIDVPNSVLTKYSLTSGNKQRVLAFAKEMEANLQGEFSYICLTDRDLDPWFGKLEVIRNHRWTTYSSLEMHFVNREFVSHLLYDVCRVKMDDFSAIYESSIQLLKMYFSFRCTAKELSLDFTTIPIKKCVSKKDGTLYFEFDEFIQKSLNKNGQIELFSDVKSKVDKWYNNFNGDERHYIRGHDFFELMAFIVKQFGGYKELSTEVAISRLCINSALNDSRISAEIT